MVWRAYPLGKQLDVIGAARNIFYENVFATNKILLPVVEVVSVILVMVFWSLLAGSSS